MRAALCAKKHGHGLEHCNGWKIPSEKLAVAFNPGGHSIRVLVEICVLCGKLILRRDVLISQQLFWGSEKLNFLSKLISKTLCSLGLLNLRQSNVFSLKMISNFVFGLVSLDRLQTETAQVFFPSRFLKKKRLNFLLPASCTCSMHQQDALVLYRSSHHIKYDLNSQNSLS